MKFFVTSLMMVLSVTTVKAAEVDTVWVEVPDTILVKQQRPVVKDVRKKIEEPIFFKIRESDSRVASGIDAAIKKVADLMKTSDDALFTVTGYADRGTGTSALNQMYAQRRADDVTRKLINEHGLDPARLKSDSKGDKVQPFADNDKNRCVIITGEGTFKVTHYEEVDVPQISTKRVAHLVERPEVVQPYIPTDSVIARREWLSVKTNLLFYGAYVPGYNRWCPIPNVAIEYYPLHGHFTYGASLDFPWWRHYDKHKFFELRNYQLETRYYFRSGDVHQNIPGQGAAYRGFYLQGYAHVGLFLIGFNADKGWTGEYVGGGVGFGYVMPLSKKGHWRLDFGLQVGYFFTKNDPFQYEYRGGVEMHDNKYYYDWTLSPDLFRKRRYHYSWFGPTRIGITLSYDLLYRRHAKRGVSFKSYQEVERRYQP